MEDFKSNLINKLKEKGLSESSIKLYIRNLEKLNNGEDLIRVTCYPSIVYWLEKLIGKVQPVPIPELPSKIDCCHLLD